MLQTRYQTLPEMLDHQVRRNGERTAYIFEGIPRRFQDLGSAVNRFAAFLIDNGIKHEDRILLALPNGDDFFDAFYGCLKAGAAAVPIFPDSGLDRIAAFADICEARAVVLPSSSPQEKIDGLNTAFRSKQRWVVTPACCRDHKEKTGYPEILPDNTAFIQYTSGSTGNSKGVVITHRQILINLEQMIQGMKITDKDIFVSWIPVYHDMGLILMTMVPFYLAARLILLPTSLINLRKWIEAIHHNKGTFTAAPDFAYRMSLVYIKEAGRYDLSSLRVALNAAEPVRASTVLRFEEKFGLKSVMSPAYGLAEATVGVSMWPPGTPIKIAKRGFVSVGKGFPGIEIRIIGKQRTLGPNRIGEIVVKSPANSKGYFRNEQETGNLFWRKNYIRTGDLGWLDEEGDLFIAGRIKNLIIQGGMNVSPQEIEELVDELPFVRFSAAIGIDRGELEGEQLYVFVEFRGASSSAENLKQVSIKIVQKIQFHMGFRPGRIFLLKPHSIPRTFNGKIQHAVLKNQYQTSKLHTTGRIIFPGY